MKTPTEDVRSVEEGGDEGLSGSISSVTFVVINTTNRLFFRRVYTLERGSWAIFPPELIEPKTRIRFASRNDGIAGGTAGQIFYKDGAQSGEEFEISWTNPFVGQSEFKAAFITNEDDHLQIETQATHGYHAEVLVTISDVVEHIEHSRSSTPAVVMTSTRVLVSECSCCGRYLEERKHYCSPCLKQVMDENRNMILQKIIHLKRLQEENNNTSEKLIQEEIRQQRNLVQLRIERGKWAQKVKNIKERITNLQKVIKHDRHEIEMLKSGNHQKKRDLINANNILVTHSTRVDNRHTPSVKQLAHENRKYFDKLAQNRKYLIAELLSFFPVTPLSEMECSIINIKLPNSSNIWPDLPPEILAAALGYLVHFIKRMTRYLDICLPYQMEFLGSRSMIWREGSNKKYILFNYSSPQEFRVALEMLNWNVVHLCLSQGLPVSTVMDHYEQLLPNLLAIFRSPTLGVEGQVAEEKEVTRSPIKTNRRRTVSISSLAMPNVESSSLSNNQNRLSLSARNENFNNLMDVNINNNYDPSAPPEEPNNLPDTSFKKKSQDDEEEDFIVIENVAVPPPPSETESDLANFERAMFVDKV